MTRLVGEFCAHIEALVGDPDAREKAHDQVLDLARIFSGEHPSWAPIKGYHGVSLPGKLQADLGPYWLEHRAEWGNDAVAVLFDWLGAHVVDAVKKAEGDDHLLGATLRPSVQYAVRALLGIDQRQVPAGT